MLAVVAVGGVAGAEARYGVDRVLPTPAHGFPWSTFLVNASGCLALGVLVVLAVDGSVSRYLRPFLGVGVLGGYTTFSAFALETRDRLVSGRPGLAGTYLVASVVAGLAAMWVGIVLGRVTWQVASNVRRARVRRDRRRRAAAARRTGESPSQSHEAASNRTTRSAR